MSEHDANREVVALHRLLLAGQDAQRTICFDGDTLRTWGEFLHSVATRAAVLRTHAAQRWLLSETNLYAFACGLFALWHANKEAVIPPNLQAGSLARMHEQGCYDAVFDFNARGNNAAPLGVIDRNVAILHLHTSGSTGEPKKVSKSLAQLEAEIETLESLWGGTIGEARVLATVPHQHIYGLLFRLLWPLAAARPFDTVLCGEPDSLMERLRHAADAILVASPAQLSRLTELVSLDALRPALKLIFSSGGPLARDTAMAFSAAFGQAPTEVYGSTETGGIAWRRQDIDPAWKPLPGLSVQRGVDGALLLRSPFLATAELSRSEDAIDLQEDGRFILRGRLDRIVKVEEKRLSLPEMEARLCEHPWIAECALLAMQSNRQYIASAIVLSAAGREAFKLQDRKTTVKTLRTHLRRDYEAVLLPRRWRFVERLPLNERGKLSQSALSTLFSDPLDADTSAAA